MISAKNYAAQAEATFRSVADAYPTAAKLSKIIADAEHFTIPDEGLIFADGLRGLEGVPIFLPFKSITIEFSLSQKASCPDKMIILAYESGDDICVGMIPHFSKSGWIYRRAFYKFKRGSTYGDMWSIENLFFSEDDMLEEKAALQHLTGPARTEKISHGFWQTAIYLFELLEALSCKNVSTANIQEAQRNNAKRIKAGKIPFYETKILVIDADRPKPGKFSSGGTHASPKQHLRRGHIRRLEKGNIWINSCVIGDASKGSVAKSYAIC